MPTQSFTDQMGQEVLISFPPKRIISLVPSQTELLADLGLTDSVVGITKFCIHPPSWRTEKTIIGGTKKFLLDRIDSINPDLIIGNKEENYKEGVDLLRVKYPVWMSDIVSLHDSMNMIRALGELTDRIAKANRIAEDVEVKFSDLKIFSGQRVLYLIWQNPWMAAGRDTFINCLLETIGLKNALEVSRYPTLSINQLQMLNPDFVFLSSEPFPFNQSHLEALSKHFPTTTIQLVDGEMFSWYGSRLLKAPDYFRSLSI